LASKEELIEAPKRAVGRPRGSTSMSASAGRRTVEAAVIAHNERRAEQGLPPIDEEKFTVIGAMVRNALEYDDLKDDPNPAKRDEWDSIKSTAMWDRVAPYTTRKLPNVTPLEAAKLDAASEEDEAKDAFSQIMAAVRHGATTQKQQLLADVDRERDQVMAAVETEVLVLEVTDTQVNR